MLRHGDSFNTLESFGETRAIKTATAESAVQPTEKSSDLKSGGRLALLFLWDSAHAVTCSNLPLILSAYSDRACRDLTMDPTSDERLTPAAIKHRRPSLVIFKRQEMSLHQMATSG